MRSEVNRLLRTNYKGREWDAWFQNAAQKLSEHLDSSSLESVRCHALLVKVVSLHTCIRSSLLRIQSMDRSATGGGFAKRPADASKQEIADIKAELGHILRDPKSDSLSHEQIQKNTNSALQTKYEGREWTAWFKVTIEEVFDTLDSESDASRLSGKLSESESWAD